MTIEKALIQEICLQNPTWDFFGPPTSQFYFDENNDLEIQEGAGWS